MSDMAPINATIDGAALTFKLAEADIPTLTFVNDSAGVIQGATLDAYLQLVPLIGVKRTDYPREIGPTFAPSLFDSLVAPKGSGDYSLVRPTGKALLARAAALLENSLPYPIVVKATLTLALKAGMGVDIKTAAGMADNISHSTKSAAGKMSYVHQVLVPSILAAAAAA